jgi:hypothetical protein
MKNTCKIVIKKLEGKGPLRRLRYRWDGDGGDDDDSNKMHLKEIERKIVT